MSKRPIGCFLLIAAAAAVTSFAQQVIQLPLPGASNPAGANAEKQYFSKSWNTEIVTNVSQPSLTVYKPAAQSALSDVGIIVCPGGGFMALSINSEGIDVAKWLNGRGITAFVLKYRLAPTQGDAAEEFQRLWSTDQSKLKEILERAIPVAVADGHTAVEYVRKHASEFGISPDKIGIMGFSAGGTVTAAAALQYSAESRPAFAAPIYPAIPSPVQTVPGDAPPLFITAATDDNLGLGPDSVRLYQMWTGAHHSAELHMYAKGGHGFGMRITGLPSQEWIDRFWEWLTSEGVLPR